MTDSSMNFGPAWIRNLRSEGSTGGGTGTAGTRYQLAEHRYGREEMLVLFDKAVKPPPTLAAFKALYSEQTLVPLALLETSEEEQRVWQSRPTSIGGPNRGRGVSLERGGRTTRGRGNYPTYGRTPSTYDSGWGNGEQSDWSPRKDYTRSNTTDNWRRVRSNEDDEGWRSMSTSRPLHEKWGRSTSWRGDGDTDERNGPPERGGRQSWHENNRNLTRRSWENEDHLPEWVNENPTEGGGTFDERGAFHGSDDEQSGGDNKINKKELQKSASQQQIGNRNNHPPILSTSKSAISLTKTEHNEKQSENLNERDKETSKIKGNTSPEPEKPPSIADKSNTDDESDKSGKREEELRSITTEKTNDDSNSVVTGNNTAPPQHSSSTNIDRVEEEFARMQEDLVLKLVVDEETPNTVIQNSSSSATTVVTTTTTNFDVTNTVQPPPNLVPSVPTVPPPPLPPSQDKWYYQDPQGTRQGPFLNVEMAEWYKAGYFSNQLRVMRECDERYFLLGELINLCGGDNPFLSNIRFPILKNETPTKLNDDMLSYQLLSQLAFKQQISMRNLTEPWSALTLQQQELAAQRLLLQQQQQQQQQHQQQPPQQLPHDLQYMQQSAPPANPLMFMINQMQQSNKLHGSLLVDKPINSSSSNSSVPNPLDTLPVQMGGGIHSLQNRIPPQNLHNHILPTNLSSSLPSDSLNGGLPGLQTNSLPTPGLSTLPNLHSALPTGLNVNRPTSHSPIDQLPPTNQENDPITNFLKQFHQQKQRAQMPLDGSMWHKPTNQFNVPQAAAVTTTTTTQWPQQPDVPLSMWDLQPPPLPTSLSSDNQTIPIDKPQEDPQQSQEVENEQQQQQRSKEETPQKELKRKKEVDEKQAKKNTEEKRKQEQRRHEAEKKAAEEKKKKEEERIRKELERAKREAEEKRMRELEEKRRLKEQRKAEEEARKKSEELKKQEEEKLKREAKEREERKQAETRLIQNQVIKTAKAAPWSQANSNQGMSLTDIQKAEKERRAQEAALLLKQQQLQEQQQQQLQQQGEKSSGIQLNWAKKPIEPKHVKSFAEIQAEEQERLAKMTAEARLAAQQREKEIPASNTNSIWNGQSLTWANATTTSQWSNSNAAAGFWDDILVKPSPKPSTVPKSSSTSAMSSVASKQTPPPPPPSQPTSQKQTKTKIKKEEPQKSVNSNNNNNSNSNNNNSANDEFTNWCYKTLSTISTNVDIPTFVSFLRDIESAYDVRDYCKEYLGDSAATQQFATNFLEKRRSFKPKTNAHKDDMCSPAPAITPSTQHSTEFQEVKGKNKKNKKSKMLKVDSRILGFQVTSAPDRINVGDRDYGDNS